MNKIIITGLIVILIVLAGCDSTIPIDERKEFCKSLGLTGGSGEENKFYCLIYDSEYLEIKDKINPYGANYTDCYDRKFIDINKIPKCNEWCNEGALYDWDSCFHNCINTWRICKQK